jgi:hypothetical protein
LKTEDQTGTASRTLWDEIRALLPEHAFVREEDVIEVGDVDSALRKLIRRSLPDSDIAEETRPATRRVLQAVWSVAKVGAWEVLTHPCGWPDTDRHDVKITGPGDSVLRGYSMSPEQLLGAIKAMGGTNQS